ncbi:MAG: hypothetical protein OEW16_02575 [Gammaproteobacteria bacterium]|nr:hypothetical protein [Gammaproteobacteria bacterium]
MRQARRVNHEAGSHVSSPDGPASRGPGGSGRRIAAAVGAVAGAVAGQAIEEHAAREDAWQITVELDGGRTIAVEQSRDESFRIGERVRIYMRRDGTARVAKL